MTDIKVITYNIHKGFNTGNQRFVLARMRELLEEEHDDIVLLQEIHGETRRYKPKVCGLHDIPHFAYQSDPLWRHWAYGKNAINSKYPFTFWENIDISNQTYASRSILHGIIELPGRGPLHTLCVHMGLLESERRRQVDTLMERIQSHIPRDERLLIAGDFNDWKLRVESRFEADLGLRELFVELTGRHARTFPVWMPILPMDRI